MSWTHVLLLIEKGGMEFLGVVFLIELIEAIDA